MTPAKKKPEDEGIGARVSHIAKGLSGRRGDLVPGFRVPFILLGPLWAVCVGVASLWYNGERARSDAAIESVALRKDVATLVIQVSQMRDQLTLFYPRGEAVRDAEIVDLKIQSLDKRITILERKLK